MLSSSQSNDLLSGIDTNAPHDFLSYLSMKEKIEKYATQSKIQHADNLHAIENIEKKSLTLLIELKINFIKKMLSNDHIRYLLFGWNNQNPDEVNKTFKKLSLEFHTDKCEDLNCPELIKTFYQKIITIKDNLLDTVLSSSKKNSKPNEKIYPEEKRALEFWEIAIDYQEALKKKFKFKILKWEEVIELSEEKLIDLRKEYAIKAYKEYLKACEKADRDKEIDKSISLRKCMSMSLYLADDIYHAQVYALGTIHLLLHHSMTFSNFLNKKYLPYPHTVSVLDELQALLNKISNKNNVLKTSIISSSAQTFMANGKHKHHHQDLDKLKNLVEHDMLSFFPDVSFILNETECRAALMPIEENTSFLGTLFIIFTQPQKKFRDPSLSEQLQQLIQNALSYFYRGQYHEFLISISSEVTSQSNEETAELFCYGRHAFDPKKVVDLMLDYGYQPHGIAYLFILITNAIFNLKEGYQQTTLNDLCHMSSHLLWQIKSNIALETRAKKEVNIEKKLCLLRSIATIRLFMWDITIRHPVKEKDNMPSFLPDLLSEKEKFPEVDQKWFDPIIILMKHMAMANGFSLPILSDVALKNTVQRDDEFKQHTYSI